MIDFAQAMLRLLAIWILIVFITVGIGLCARKVLSIKARLNADSLIVSFWLGFGVLLSVLQLLHLFLPISPILPLFAASLGIIGYGLYFRDFRNLIGRLEPTRKWLIMIPVAVVFIFMSQRANGPLFDYNAGYYQLQIIEWYKQYAVVPGLGNLFGCLSYNQAYYFFASLLDQCRLFPGCESVTNGVFIVMMTLQVALWASRFGSKNAVTRIVVVFHLIFFVIVFYEAIGPNVKGVATEIASTALSLVVANELMKLLIRRQSSTSVRSQIFFVLFFSVLLVTIKVGNIFFAFNASLLALWMTIKSSQLNAKNLILSGKQIAAIGALAVPWIIHGAIMNGCLLYPLSFTALPFDWTVPKESIQSCANWIYGFARRPDFHWTLVQPGLGWFPDWFVYVCYIYPINTMVPWGIAAFAAPVVLLNLKQINQGFFYVLWAAALSYFCSMWLAPDTRYCVGTIWISAAIIAAMAAEVRGFSRGRALAFLAVMAVGLAVSTPRFGQSLGFTQVYQLVQSPTRDFETRSGLTVQRPISGDRLYRKIPATPFPNPYLRLRESGRIESGFVSDIKGNGVGVEP